MNHPNYIEHIDPATLVPSEGNPRVHTPQQIEEIMDSIQNFGFTMPLLVRGNVIIAGHGRHRAALNLKLATVPVLRADHLSEAEARAYRIADNAIALNSSWDYDLLREELPLLIAADLHHLIGFGDNEIDAIMNGWTPREQRARPKDDTAPVSRITVVCEREMRERVVAVVQEAIDRSRIGGVHVET